MMYNLKKKLEQSVSSKLSVSIITDQLESSGLRDVETDSLGGQEPENEINNFGHCKLGLVRSTPC